MTILPNLSGKIVEGCFRKLEKGCGRCAQMEGKMIFDEG